MRKLIEQPIQRITGKANSDLAAVVTDPGHAHNMSDPGHNHGTIGETQHNSRTWHHFCARSVARAYWRTLAHA